MPCYHPLKGYRSRTVNPSGKRSIAFNVREGFYDMPVTLPCGQCIGCRLERARQWAVRCLHEATLYEDNCFITLTYSDEHLPSDGSLQVKHFQDFIKRLRFKHGRGIRYFHCGEYGEKLGRPHYHACLFNFDFKDKQLWRRSAENPLYVSEDLNALWGLGYAVVGAVSFESAAYVARYITKKITGEDAAGHYQGRRPEYVTMSRRPGIGRGWFDKFSSDCYPSDTVVVRGRVMRPPKFYDRVFELDNPEIFSRVKSMRSAERLPDWHDENSPARLDTKERVAELTLKTLNVRRLENG